MLDDKAILPTNQPFKLRRFDNAQVFKVDTN